MTSPTGEPAIRFFGDGRAYWRLLVRGGVLVMVTLGIYRFWLTTDVRRFLWSNTEVAGDGLEYNGTPQELLIGFLTAIALLVPLYLVFFFAALDLGFIGRMSGAIGFALLFVLGQYAIYRARRYRLTRTVYRGLRFHQDGSAWGYALRAVLWWSLTLLTLGLAYPFQLASLERYKMRHTFYGDLGGRFDGSGLSLFLRGLPMWLLVVAPLAVTIGAALETLDWDALAEALASEDVQANIEVGNPGLTGVLLFGLIMLAAAAVLAALLFPAFRALTLRWWSSGLRLGPIEFRSQLRTAQVYRAYLRFFGYAVAFAIALAVLGFAVLLVLGALITDDQTGEIVATVFLLVGYVIAALGLSTIYRATALLALWRLGMESLQLSGLSALDRVRAVGRPSSALGEGLADALNVGRI
ncbi:MAG: DUF898 family protein [Pseudolabrys sp.]|nr:DUF898 family protein [Pseudolabrys sp.]